MTDKPSLGLELNPTPAMRAGRARVEGCRNCGAIVYVTGGQGRPDVLGACPVCGRSSWYRERLPVGPFRKEEPRAAYRSKPAWGAGPEDVELESPRLGPTKGEDDGE